MINVTIFFNCFFFVVQLIFSGCLVVLYLVMSMHDKTDVMTVDEAKVGEGFVANRIPLSASHGR